MYLNMYQEDILFNVTLSAGSTIKSVVKYQKLHSVKQFQSQDPVSYSLTDWRSGKKSVTLCSVVLYSPP